MRNLDDGANCTDLAAAEITTDSSYAFNLVRSCRVFVSFLLVDLLVMDSRIRPLGSVHTKTRLPWPTGLTFTWWGCVTQTNRACPLLFLSLWPFRLYFVPYSPHNSLLSHSVLPVLLIFSPTYLFVKVSLRCTNPL